MPGRTVTALELALEPSDVEAAALRELPIWAQVAVASRCVRRAALAATAFLSESQVNVLLAGCDALERSAAAGERASADRPLLGRAASLQPPVRGGDVVAALQSAVDAAHAAEASLDLSAAESTCLQSVLTAIARASTSLGLADREANALVAAECAASRAACAARGIGRYDALGTRVLASLPPIEASEPR